MLSQGIADEVVRKAAALLLAEHGQGQRERIEQGVEQVARRWWQEDGDAEGFIAFCRQSFVADAGQTERIAGHLATICEQVVGHVHEARRELTRAVDTATGPLDQIDRLLAAVDPTAHLYDDLFTAKVAFFALLNFPVHSLRDRLAEGAGWTRSTWARSRMMDHFAMRVPVPVEQQRTRALGAAERYVAAYNLRLDRLVTRQGDRLFREGLRLIAHWGLRDELAANYAEPAGLARQRAILRVFERIVRQQVPAAVIDNPDLLWDPEDNRVAPVAGSGAAAGDSLAAPEPDTRYAHLLDVFHALRQVDPYSLIEPTFIRWRCERVRQIPEQEVEALLVSVLEAPEVGDLARLIRRRLGRALEPFDIWYSGFQPRGPFAEAELDAVVRRRFPTLAAFAASLPEILRQLGFCAERARWLADRIVVEPARGAGHAMGALRREDRVHLRTRVNADGMDYKGYNIALHELGHNVEQVFSLHGMDFWWLLGVPNSAFTEAFAFVFQGRDLELLGLAAPDRRRELAPALATLWSAYEIAGMGLLEMRLWNWLYQHPQATAGELRAVWNRYYAPVIGVEDSEILATYSHVLFQPLYLADYAIGYLISFQVAAALGRGDFGAEFERMARLGRLTPDAWMRAAVGAPISARVLLDSARDALESAPE
jgi:hypothetical protein